ncbi:hypothetical protein [Kribbella rubisoli]|nr:hypothetical protein [Kribbella rubisoli]
MLLAEPDRRSSGLDPRCTYLLLHIDWTSPGAKTALPPIELRKWRAMMMHALATPAAVARYLVDHVGVELDDAPQPMIGFWLATSSKLTQLIDLDGLKQVEGSPPSQWYDAYAVADAAGETPNETATDWLTRLCDRALHLDSYEEAI